MGLAVSERGFETSVLRAEDLTTKHLQGKKS